MAGKRSVTTMDDGKSKVLNAKESDPPALAAMRDKLRQVASGGKEEGSRAGVKMEGGALPDGSTAPSPTGSFGSPPKLKPETQEQLAGLKSVMEREAAKEDAEVEQPKDDLSSYSQEEMNQVPPISSPDEDTKKVDEYQAEKYHSWAGPEVRRAADDLVSQKRRLAIESRCPPIKLEDLIIKGEATQRVPIIPDVLTVEFRTPTGAEDLFVKRYAVPDPELSERYMLDKFTVMQTVLGVKSVNNVPAPPLKVVDGDISSESFDARMEWFCKMPQIIVADIVINYYWFDERYRKLMNDKSMDNFLGNG